MISIQQLLRALHKLEIYGELVKSLKHMSFVSPTVRTILSFMEEKTCKLNKENSPQYNELEKLNTTLNGGENVCRQRNYNTTTETTISSIGSVNCQTTKHNIHKCPQNNNKYNQKRQQQLNKHIFSTIPASRSVKFSENGLRYSGIANCIFLRNLNKSEEKQINLHLRRTQQIHKFYQLQLHHFHTQHIQGLYAKHKQTKIAMSSLAAEPLSTVQLQLEQQQQQGSLTNGSCKGNDGTECNSKVNDSTTSTTSASTSTSNTSGRPCFNTGFGEIIQFMELIGNLKHTKRTGWVLRDVNDCESISGHMYRMSMMTFLLDGTEGLNQIRCMELALVHDLAESLVGDITPFCGVSKQRKRAMEFKAMEDICKLIEPRGKRIMELFEEYENGESAESKFVKDLDRLDMVMQAFEYEKRDNCLLKHQEFFDSTEGKFNHPFVKKLVNEIYEQRQLLAKSRGATPPQHVDVPNMDDNKIKCILTKAEETTTISSSSSSSLSSSSSSVQALTTSQKLSTNSTTAIDDMNDHHTNSTSKTNSS